MVSGRSSYRSLLWLGASLALALAIAVASFWRVVLWMPGAARPPGCRALDPEFAALEAALERHVRALAGEIGPRSYAQPEALRAAADYVERALAAAGWSPSVDAFGAQLEFRNVSAQRAGADPRGGWLIVGAHYDSVEGSPGADDNASGVAVLLELARLLRDAPLRHSLRLIAFTNEELPLGEGELAGSRVAAARSWERGEEVAGMLSLESLGSYSDEPGSQRYPAPLSLWFRDRANFVAWIGDLRSRSLLHRALAVFRAAGRLPAEGIAAPAALFPDVRRSDHAAYWERGYPALLVTGTAPFRNPHYHRPGDLPERVDFPRLARATTGIAEVIACLAAGG